MSARPQAGPRPWELLYDAVALGMRAYLAGSFRVEVIDRERFRLRRGDLLVVTHRADTDVPLLCGALYLRGRVWLHRRPRTHFVARDDLFARGFLAGFLPGLAPGLRRLLYPLALAPALRRVRVHPATTARQMTLGQLLAMVPPATQLEPLLPSRLAESLRRRATERRVPAPRTAGDALGWVFADLLLGLVTPRDIPEDAVPGVWRRRVAQAVADAREIVAVVAAGEPLLLFPEGRRSPDGAIGPVERALEGIIRRGRPAAMVPVGVAYDPLVSGRTRAYIGIGAPFSPPPDDAVRMVLGELRRAMPLSCGQVVSGRLLAAAERGTVALDVALLEDALEEAVAEASQSGRPVERSLIDAGPRRRRLRGCLRRLEREGLVSGRGPRSLILSPELVTVFAPIRRLARENASARELDPPRPRSSRSS